MSARIIARNRLPTKTELLWTCWAIFVTDSPAFQAVRIIKSLVSWCIFIRAVSAGGAVIRKRLFLVDFYQKLFGGG